MLRSIHMYKKKAQNTLIFYDSEKSQFSSVKLNSELKFLHLAHRYSETKCPEKSIHSTVKKLQLFCKIALPTIYRKLHDQFSSHERAS